MRCPRTFGSQLSPRSALQRSAPPS